MNDTTEKPDLWQELIDNKEDFIGGIYHEHDYRFGRAEGVIETIELEIRPPTTLKDTDDRYLNVRGKVIWVKPRGQEKKMAEAGNDSGGFGTSDSCSSISRRPYGYRISAPVHGGSFRVYRKGYEHS